MTKKIIISTIIAATLLICGFFLGRDESAPNDEDMRVPAVQIPEQENAFYDFNQAADKIYWPAEKEELISNIIKGKEWDNNFAEELLEKNKESFFYIEKGLGRSVFQFPQFQDVESLPYIVDMPTNKKLINITKVYAVKALHFYRQGEEEEALNEIIKIFKVGKLVEYSPRPYFLQVFQGRSIIKIGIETIRIIIKDTKLSSEALKFYIKELDDFKFNTEGVKISLKTEYRALTKSFGKDDVLNLIKEIDTTESINTKFYFSPISKLMFKTPFYYKPNQTRRLFLGDFRRGIKNLDKNYCNEVEEIDINRHLLFYGVSEDSPMKLIIENFMGKMLFWDILNPLYIPPTKCRENFELLGTQLLISIKAFQIENGRLPISLNELVPKYISDIPNDPFDGSPIRYSPEKKVIYSVGSDFIDSNGGSGEETGLERTKEPTIKIEF